MMRATWVSLRLMMRCGQPLLALLLLGLVLVPAVLTADVGGYDSDPSCLVRSRMKPRGGIYPYRIDLATDGPRLWARRRLAPALAESCAFS